MYKELSRFPGVTKGFLTTKEISTIIRGINTMPACRFRSDSYSKSYFIVTICVICGLLPPVLNLNNHNHLRSIKNTNKAVAFHKNPKHLVKQAHLPLVLRRL